MHTSTRFTVAVHVLSLLNLTQSSMTSTEIAGSVNTNPVVIRRMIGVLQKAGFVQTQAGVEGGVTLARSADQIPLLAVYRATESGSLFALHASPPNPQCPCGSNIQPVLTTVFSQAEAAAEQVLAQTTIEQVTADIAGRANLVRMSV